MGHEADEPVQKSVMSQSPAEARHIVAPDWNKSKEQSLFEPSQDSETSQSPAAGRHSAVDFKSVGQDLPEPSHLSAMSQTPPDTRQV